MRTQMAALRHQFAPGLFPGVFIVRQRADQITCRAGQRIGERLGVQRGLGHAGADVRTSNAIVQRQDASRALAATQWPIIRRGPARQILGAEPMGVPGLAVRNIRRSPTGDVVLVEQAIDSVTVIQLFQERAENDQLARRAYSWSDSVRARQEAGGVQVRGGSAGTERLARFIGGVRVEIAGPLSADSLNRLLEQLKAIP